MLNKFINIFTNNPSEFAPLFIIVGNIFFVVQTCQINPSLFLKMFANPKSFANFSMNEDSSGKSYQKCIICYTSFFSLLCKAFHASIWWQKLYLRFMTQVTNYILQIRNSSGQQIVNDIVCRRPIG